jgi:hypothetical protein
VTTKNAEGSPEYQEGPDAARRFEASMNRVLKVSKDELVKREAAYKKSQHRKKAHHKSR